MTTALDSSSFEFFEFWIWTNHNSLLSIATNQFASFFIDIRSRQCYFRVCQSGEIWNKRAFFPCILIFLIYKTKCGKNISDTLGCASCATFLFLPHFDVIYDLLLNRRTVTWNLFVKHMICNSNWTRNEWSTIQGVIARVISKSDEREARGRFDITSATTPWIVRHEVQLLINRNYNKIRQEYDSGINYLTGWYIQLLS